MNYKALNQILTIVLVISFSLSLVLVLWGIINSFADKASQNIEIESFTKNLKMDEAKAPAGEEVKLSGGCSSNWKCGNWSECKVTYNTEDAIYGNVILSGQRDRECTNLNSCSPNKIESEECDTKALVSVKKVNKCSKDYLEIRDQNGALISRVEIAGVDSPINIQLLLGKTEYCPYCYDSVKDYDEDGIDCSYNGDSCPSC